MASHLLLDAEIQRLLEEEDSDLSDSDIACLSMLGKMSK